jgi:hypothetical protein
MVPVCAVAALLSTANSPVNTTIRTLLISDLLGKWVYFGKGDIHYTLNKLLAKDFSIVIRNDRIN